MTQMLRQSTAGQVVLLGPFIDDTDFKTLETGLTIANSDIKLRKHGATAFVDKNSGGATHIASGFYHATLDATDTNTAGMLEIVVAVAGALVVWARFEVLPAEVYDERVNADGPIPRMGIMDQGTAQGATSTTVQLRGAATFADDSIVGAVILAHGSTQGYWQVRTIADHVAATDTVTVSPAFTVTPTGTIAYKILAAPPAVTAPGSLPQVVAESLGTQAKADVNAEVDTAIADAALATSAAVAAVDGKIDTIDTNVDTILTENVLLKRNTAVTALPFYMKLTDGSPGTGLTVTVQVSKDGGAFATVAGSVTEISGGWYAVDLTATETNAKFVAFKATAAGAEQRNFLIVTQD